MDASGRPAYRVSPGFSVRIGVTRGLDAFGATERTDPLRSRATGSSDFTNADFTVIRNQPLPRGLSLYLFAQGQFTLGKPLLSVSECTYGGRVVGRGYDIGSMSGDDCFMVASELRWTRSLGSSRQLQLYTFVDAGRVSQQGELEIGEAGTRTAQSRGLGARLELGGRLMAHIEAASPTKPEYTERGKSSPRVYFSLATRF